MIGDHASVIIVAFDDLELSRHIRPTLTTVHVSTESMWHTVADRMLAALAQQPAPASTEVEVELMHATL